MPRPKLLPKPEVEFDSPPPVLPKIKHSSATVPWTPAKEEAMRAAIVKEAQSWILTPYQQQGDIKGAAVDCSMLLVRCWVDSGILEPFDPRPYPANWHMHHSTERYLEWMNTLAKEVDEKDVQPGDVALFRFGRCFSHGGIMVSSDKVVSAASAHDAVLTSRLSDPWLRYEKDGRRLRPRKFFDVFGRIREQVT